MRFIKRIVSWLLVSVIAVTAFACTDITDKDPEPADTKQEKEAVWHTGTEAPLNSFGADGDFYVNTGDIGVFIKIDGIWFSIAIAGTNGDNGLNGKSAYEIWLDNDHEGTEAEFLDWLKGAAGAPGTPGMSAYETWLYNGHEGTEAEFLDWLKGDPGAPGMSAYEIYLEYHPEYEGDEEQWMDDLVNGRLADKEMSDFAKFMDDKTILVNMVEIWGPGWDDWYENGVIGSRPDRTFTTDDFAAVDAVDIFWINEAEYEYRKTTSGEMFAYFQYFYAVKVGDNGDMSMEETAKEIEKLDFVKHAWPNYYDYSSSPAPAEEKLIWQGSIEWDFNDRLVTVMVDMSFFYRMFILEDFNMIDAVSARLNNLSAIYAFISTGGQTYQQYLTIAITIGNRGKQNVIDTIRELEKLDFVYHASPVIIYWPAD